MLYTTEATHDSQLRSRHDDADGGVQSLAQSTAARDSGYERFFSDKLADGTPGPRMAFIPAGSFVMGAPQGEYGRRDSEGPLREVVFSRPFAMACHATTRAEYFRFLRETGHRLPRRYSWTTPTFPVFNVSFHDAEAFARWLSEQTGQHYRLPTEAEWEYAARAGTQTAFTFGERIRKEEVNCAGGFHCTRGLFLCGIGKPVPVGSLPPNAWGLHEVHGNVQELTLDHWSDNLRHRPVEGSSPYVSSDPKCRRLRVVRGGSWFDKPERCRSASRAPRNVIEFDLNLGFRLVREIG